MQRPVQGSQSVSSKKASQQEIGLPAVLGECPYCSCAACHADQELYEVIPEFDQMYHVVMPSLSKVLRREALPR